MPNNITEQVLSILAESEKRLAAHTDLPAFVKALRVAVDAIEAAEIRFLNYARLHEKKGTQDGARNAARNADAALECVRSLESILEILK